MPDNASNLEDIHRLKSTCFCNLSSF